MLLPVSCFTQLIVLPVQLSCSMYQFSSFSRLHRIPSYVCRALLARFLHVSRLLGGVCFLYAHGVQISETLLSIILDVDPLVQLLDPIDDNSVSIFPIAVWCFAVFKGVFASFFTST